MSLFVFYTFYILLCFVFFFFSSRRRHTRSLCDWSSDVCSSDLVIITLLRPMRSDRCPATGAAAKPAVCRDRKSTRLNSSHTVISYAVFCLKKKTKKQNKHKNRKQDSHGTRMRVTIDTQDSTEAC